MKYFVLAITLLLAQTTNIRQLQFTDALDSDQVLLSLQFNFTTQLIGANFAVLWNNGYQISVVTADLSNLGTFHAITAIPARNGESTLYISVGNGLSLSDIRLSQHFGCTDKDIPTEITGKPISELLDLPTYNVHDLTTGDLNKVLTVTISDDCLISVL